MRAWFSEYFNSTRKTNPVPKDMVSSSPSVLKCNRNRVQRTHWRAQTAPSITRTSIGCSKGVFSRKPRSGSKVARPEFSVVYAFRLNTRCGWLNPCHPCNSFYHLLVSWENEMLQGVPRQQQGRPARGDNARPGFFSGHL